MNFAGVEQFLDTPVKRYSSGMQVRLGFAVAAHLDPEILLIDEVLAVGDAAFQAKCLGQMKDIAGRDAPWSSFLTRCRPYSAYAREPSCWITAVSWPREPPVK